MSLDDLLPRTSYTITLIFPGPESVTTTFEIEVVPEEIPAEAYIPPFKPFFEEDLTEPVIFEDLFAYQLPPVFSIGSYHIEISNGKYATIDGDQLLINTTRL